MNGQPIPFDQAADIAFSLNAPRRAETIPLTAASNRILADDVHAQIQMPLFNRAMMDGYAIRAGDVQDEATQLRVIGQVAAGDGAALQVSPGEAVRIATGARVPDGADSVARFEWCEAIEDGAVRVLHPITNGESIQPAGQDGEPGQVLMRAGMRLTGARMAVCKTFGVREVTVAAVPTVAIILTGDELAADSNHPLEPGQIYASTDAYLAAALELDGCRITSIQYAKDNPDDIQRAVLAAATEADCRSVLAAAGRADWGTVPDTADAANCGADYILLTGGISAGDFDYVPKVLKQLCGDPAIERVLMRPGSPFVATQLHRTTIFAMSGNPAAGLIQFEMFVRPTIRRTLGIMDRPFAASGKLAHRIEQKPIKHVRVLRAHASVRAGEIWVDARMAQSPGVMAELATANCLIRMDESVGEPGQVVPLRWLDGLCLTEV